MINNITDTKLAVDSIVSSALTNSKITTQGVQSVETLNKLPLDEDPEILLKQKEAEALEKKIELEEKRKQLKEDAIEFAKQQLLNFVLPKLPIPKLPVIDPKILKTISIAKQVKSYRKEKQKNAKANAEKAKEVYKYSMKTRENIVPEVPQLPTLPEIPQVPNINLPQL